MKIILIIISIFLFLMLIIRPLINKKLSIISDKDWDWAINNPEINQMFKNVFKIDNINYVIENLLKPFKINYTKFVSNLTWLYTEGTSNNTSYNIITPSIKYFSREIDRPHMPIWYIAAFPDINKWRNDDNTTEEEVENKLHIGLDELDMPNVDGNIYYLNEGVPIMKKIVENYLKNIKPYLETR